MIHNVSGKTDIAHSPLMLKLCVLLVGWLGILSVDAACAQSSGGAVIVQFNTDSAYVVRENNFTQVELMHSGDTISVDSEKTTYIHAAVHNRPPVRKEFKVEQGKFTTIYVDLQESDDQHETLDNNHAAAYLTGRNVVIETDAQSKVYYNWNYVGDGTQAISAGNRIATVEVEHPDKGKVSRRITLDLNTMNYFEMYQEYSKNQIRYAGILPGFAQYRKDEKLKMTGILGVMGISVYKMTDLWEDDKPLLKLFRRQKAIYENTTNEGLALKTAMEMNRLQSEIADIQNEFRLWTGILITTYALNVLDALFMEPEGGYRRNNPFQLNVNMVDGQPSAVIGYKANF